MTNTIFFEMSEIPSYQRFLAEFKRRHVFRVAAVYGGAAFVLLQVADLLQEGLQLPQTFLTVSTVAVLAGFPVAQPVGHSSLNAMLVTEILRGEPRFEAAIATLNIPDPPPEAEAISW